MGGEDRRYTVGTKVVRKAGEEIKPVSVAGRDPVVKKYHDVSSIAKNMSVV